MNELEKRFYDLTIKELIITNSDTGEEIPIEIPEDIKIQCAEVNAKLCKEEIRKAFNEARLGKYDVPMFGELDWKNKWKSSEDYIKSL